jgi:hypothetical protein
VHTFLLNGRDHLGDLGADGCNKKITEFNWLWTGSSSGFHKGWEFFFNKLAAVNFSRIPLLGEWPAELF